MDRNDLLMIRLCEYFKSNPKSLEVMHELLNKNASLTLRVIDWFVTYYCKYNTNEYYRIFVSYKLQLKSFSKKMFDPFCRGSRIELRLDENTVISTTVGQLNFFKWLIENDIIAYYEKEKVEINKAMLENGFKVKLEGRGRMKKSKSNQPLITVSSSSSLSSYNR
jgi:hypothetical protein